MILDDDKKIKEDIFKNADKLSRSIEEWYWNLLSEKHGEICQVELFSFFVKESSDHFILMNTVLESPDRSLAGFVKCGLKNLRNYLMEGKIYFKD